MNVARQKAVTLQSPKQAKILIVEDNPDHWMVIQKAMQQCFSEAEPVLARSDNQALEYLEEWSDRGVGMPQLVLLDLYLPRRENGWHLLQKIKDKPSPVNQLPIVMLSNSEQTDDISEAYDRGVSSYVVKPKDYNEWVSYFQTLREYWWETVSLPNNQPLY